MDYLAFERRLLKLIFRSNVPLTPVHVAYYLQLPIAEARSHLESMVSSGILEIDSDEAGHIMYSYPLRPPLASLPDPKPPRRKKKKSATDMVPVSPGGSSTMPAPLPVPVSQSANAELMLLEERRFSPAAAAALSFFLPGVGQIYSGRVPQGIGWMLATGLGYLLFLVPGLILHICCVVNAAAVPSRLPALAERIR